MKMCHVIVSHYIYYTLLMLLVDIHITLCMYSMDINSCVPPPVLHCPGNTLPLSLLLYVTQCMLVLGECCFVPLYSITVKTT